MSILIIAIISSFIGCILVARGKAWYANLLWMIGNPIFIYHNYMLGDYPEVLMWCGYGLLAIYGVIYLRPKRSNKYERNTESK